MKDFLKKLKRFNQVEFMIATLILTGALISITTEEALDIDSHFGRIIPYTSAFARELSQSLTLYFSFTLLSLFVIPKLIERKFIQLNIVLILVVFIVLGAVWGSFDFGFIPLFVFAVYSAVKFGLIYIWWSSQDLHLKYRFLAPGVLLVFTLWLLSIVFFFIGDAEREVIAVWGTLIPFGIFLYSYSFYNLIPHALSKPKPLLAYLWKVLIVLVLAVLPLALLIFLITRDDQAPFIIAFVNVFFQLVITTPFSWMLYKRYMQGSDEVISLQKELGKSTAKLDFLRSQINPHFLFNALNTLYGTAIQEKADRTGEGIQKLGDMMRFMLQENMQDKILLAREIEYLNNYINLQKLRTDAIPGVNIETEIEQQEQLAQIAPMLLIPFVENAFKHGISFRDPSYIKITLGLNEKELLFDVSNSNHKKVENDPEKNKSGIGLKNVKQRLELLYPKKHELIIRETDKDFFIHLTIQLS
jgi:two-component system LytT family sensor kinase